VTLEALPPYRVAFRRPTDDPQPVPCLDVPANRAQGAIDVQLEVLLQTQQLREVGQAAGAQIELTVGGKQPLTLQNGQIRSHLEDGDAVVLRGWCEKPGAARIGFGECIGYVLPARA